MARVGQRENDHLQDLGLNGNLMLKWMLKQLNGVL